MSINKGQRKLRGANRVARDQQIRDEYQKLINAGIVTHRVMRFLSWSYGLEHTTINLILKTQPPSI